MLVAAGFKTITPKNPTQQQKLQQLPPGKIAMIQKSGKTFYVYPDAAHNQAYVGGPQEYQAYEQARATNKLAQENLETAEMYQDTAMGWGGWGGWGGRLGSNGNGGNRNETFLSASKEQTNNKKQNHETNNIETLGCFTDCRPRCNLGPGARQETQHPVHHGR